VIRLDDERAHYLRSVLRLKQDAALVLFNGQGGEYSSTITTITRHEVLVAIGAWQARHSESTLMIELGLGVSRSERMDFAIQKAVELGVNAITPLLMKRCVVQLRGARLVSKQTHWQRIVEHACEQCGRDRIPSVAQATVTDDWLARATGIKILLDPTAQRTLRELEPGDGKVSILSGPEGGFSDDERDHAVAAGFQPVRLGPRILRTETAALAVLAAVQTLWGDFN